jgi:hypothetical protein
MSDRPDWIEVQLNAGKKALSADALGEIFRDSLDLLKAVDRGMSPHGTEIVDWEISEARMQSPLAIRLRGNNAPPVVEAVGPGMESLNGSNDCPPHFTPDALRFVRRLVDHSAAYGVIPVFITFTKTVPVERVAGENADWALKTLMLKKQTHSEYGSLRGELTELSKSSRKRDKLVLVDRLTGEQTPCYVGEELDPEIRAAWKRRVVVTGRIIVNHETRKKAIHVERIRVLRERKDLPQIEDLHGIDITGGAESSEYIRNLRDADED